MFDISSRLQGVLEQNYLVYSTIDLSLSHSNTSLAYIHHWHTQGLLPPPPLPQSLSHYYVLLEHPCRSQVFRRVL